MENHFGENVWVTRKGAVRARKDEWGIIPGSMGTKSYIVQGLGNPDSFCSCSHGAGRVMSRTAARKRISLEEHEQALVGVDCNKTASTLDESPAAYKDIDAVMEAQKDLVVIRHTLKQVMCIKG
jgi:tRNA-splicing ligase RtcB